jgi:ElaB/YqjD/DUF883 family membrane-anchored ribosome-binding protein
MQIDTATIACVADGAIPVRRRVKFTNSATTALEVELAGLGEDCDGITETASTAAGEAITVALLNKPGTFEVEAAGAFAQGAALYGAALGKVDDVVAGRSQFVALQASTGAGCAIHVREATELVAAAEVAAIDNDAGGTTGGTERLAMTSSAIDDDAGGTHGGTERFAMTSSAIDDDAGGTHGGTERFALASAAIDDDCGGTNGGTERLSPLLTASGSAGYNAPIANNFAVLADELNEVRTDLKNNLKVASTEFNKLRTDVANNLKVASTEFNQLRTDVMNNFKVVSTQINAIIDALQTAGLMED